MLKFKVEMSHEKSRKEIDGQRSWYDQMRSRFDETRKTNGLELATTRKRLELVKSSEIVLEQRTLSIRGTNFMLEEIGIIHLTIWQLFVSGLMSFRLLEKRTIILPGLKS